MLSSSTKALLWYRYQITYSWEGNKYIIFMFITGLLYNDRFSSHADHNKPLTQHTFNEAIHWLLSSH